MRATRRKRGHYLLAAAIVAGMTVTTAMGTLASPVGTGMGQTSERQVITEIDFSEMADLNTLPAGWKVDGGGGTAALVDAGQGNGEKALELKRTRDGSSTQLYHDTLDIKEETYPYVTLETRMKLISENHANQWSIPYLKDKNNTIAYTLFTDGDWTEYKTHVNGKNVRKAGVTKPGEWQDVRFDIDLKNDTFRVSVDGVYVLYDEKARSAADSLKTIQFYADSWNRGTICIQSVKVTGQKERTESAVFYVSSQGDDSAAGTSEDAAWKTLSRVNQEHFIPGDRILFCCGDEWENETLFPHGSGENGNMISIGSYGNGAMPKISANGKAADAVCLYNQEYWEISGLDISNAVEGFGQLTGGGSGDGTPPASNNGTRDNAEGAKLGDYRGIHITGRDVPSLKGYHLHDLKVHDVTGEVAWIGNTGLNDAGIVNNAGLDGSKRTGGILIECLAPSGKQPTQFSDITIEKSEFINNSFCGITIKQWNGSGNQYGSNPGWANRNGSGGKPDYYSSNWYPHSNIIIQDNYINQGASAYACNGIYLTSSRDSVIQRNVLEHIGTCGIELYFTDNVAVQYNEVSDVIKKGGGADDNAIDPDWRVTNALIQYNYIHDAGEGFLLCGVQFNSGVIRYNLVQDCGRSYIHYSMGSGYFQIYNNVFYRSKDGNGTNNFDPWGGGAASYVNNIFYDGKKQGFNFSGGSSFAYNNNAYYGTNPTAKDGNPIILTEDPFEGTAPSMDRKGNFSTGVLLEANGLRPKADSPLIGAGVVVDTKGLSVNDGLEAKGSEFNFLPLANANPNLGSCINIVRTDYPTFEKTGGEATFDTPKTQQAADAIAPTIGMFEVPLAEDAVLLRGTVTDGPNPVAGAEVKVEAGDRRVTALTNESGYYSFTQGLKPGEATITVTYGTNGTMTETITLEGGKVNRCDFAVPLEPIPGGFSHTLIDESFDVQTDPVNFGFAKGAEIADGRLIITKTGTMGNAAAEAKTFGPEIAGQKKVDLTFDYLCTAGNKQGFEFRDSYGRLLFAICAAADKNDLRPSVTGGAAADSKAAAASEPEWKHIAMNKNTTYKIHLHADFEEKTVSYSIAEADGTVVAQEAGLPTEASDLSKMIACSWWDSKSQYIDNFKLTAPEEKPDMPLAGKTVYAFGDSIAAGHKYSRSFADWAADQEGMELHKYAVNGAAIMDAAYSGGQILAQIENASAEEPDYILFDGGTNDAEYLQNNSDVEIGTVGDGREPADFDTATFAGAFERTIYDMKQKWPDAQIIYVAVHKLGSRDWDIQEAMHDLEMQLCDKWEIAVANVYEDADLDTRDEEQKNRYTFNDLGGNGLPGTNGSGTHPNLAAVEAFYVPIVTEALKNPEVPNTNPADKSSLEALIALAEKEANEADCYTPESLEMLKKAIEEAKKVAEDKRATEAEVAAQIAELQKTMDEMSVLDSAYVTYGMKVTRKPDKLEYEIGDEFDPSGMEVTVYEKASCSNAAVSEASKRGRKLSSDEYEVAVEAFDTAGNKAVEVIYTWEDRDGAVKELTDSFTVKVGEAPEDVYCPLSIKLERKPNKTDYEVGDSFDPAGMKVSVHEKASPSNAVRDRVLDEDEYGTEHEPFDTAGTKKVTVTYTAENRDGEEEVFTASFTVKVTEAWEEYYTTGIQVKKKPDKTTYKAGEEFDPEGMKVVAIERASASNASRRERVLTEDEYEMEIPSFETAGTKTIRIVYAAADKNGEDKIFRDSFTVKVTRRSSSNGGGSGSSGSTSSYKPDDSITGTWTGGTDQPWKFRKSDGSFVVNGWARIKGQWYHFDEEGNMQTGWILAEGKWYLLNSEGAMHADDWVLVNDKWYFLNGDGSMKCGEWYFYKDFWYYFGADGSMAAAEVTPDGYAVDAEGRWIP